MLIEGFKEEQVAWNSSDYRFTTKGNTVYAFMLCPPENRVAVVRSFQRDECVGSVSLLGHGECAFSQNFGVLTVEMPDHLPTKYTNTLAIELKAKWS